MTLSAVLFDMDGLMIESEHIQSKSLNDLSYGQIVKIGIVGVTIITKMNDEKLLDWLDRLGEKQPTPGGGAVAAINGAIASAQAKMIIEYTKEGLPAFDFEKSISMFVGLSKQDEEAFMNVQSAYKSKVPQQIQKALIEATEPSIDVIEECKKVFKFVSVYHSKINKNLTADLVVVLSNLKASIEGSVAMLKVNAKYIESEELSSDFNRIIGECLILCEKIDSLKAKTIETL